MEKGQLVRVDITDITQEGHGVGRTEDGMAVFVPKALPGDVVDAEITKCKKRWAEARLVRLAAPSPDRRDAYCPYDDDCGGCPLGRLDPAAEGALDERHVRDVLERIGGVDRPEVLPAVGVPDGEVPRYRNKAVIRVSARPGEDPRVGFYARRSHRVVDCRDCRILARPAAALAGALREHLSRAARQEGGSAGMIRQLTVRMSRETGEVMAVLTCGPGRPRDLDALVLRMDRAVNALAAAPGEADDAEGREMADGPDWSLESVWLEEERPGGKSRLRLLAGSRVLHDRIGPARFEISPRAFWQVNMLTTEKLYDQVFRFADLRPGARVLDVYCGVGSIGIYLSKRMRGQISLIGFEASEDAVRDANRNAVINGIVDARYFAGTAETVLPRLLAQSRAPEEGRADDAGGGRTEDPDGAPRVPAPDLRRIDCAVLDPPRAGCDEALLRALADEARPDAIVYVSCEPGTMARDVKWLTARAYRFVRAVPVSMFPATGRTEAVVLLRRVDGAASPEA